MTGRRTAIAAALSGLALLQVAAATMGSGATFTSSSRNATNLVRSGDWTAPQVSLANPGSPLRGAVPITATAADAIGSVASVRIQRRSAGGAWSDVCAPAASPYACSWNTTGLADGSYDLRAVATDDSGNIGTSAIVAGRVIANALPVVSLGNPGSPLRGSVTLGATASSLAGIQSVRIQRSRSGSGSWADVCTDQTAPYSCALNTAALTNDRYDLRAIAADGLGGTTTSAAVANVQIDNAPPSISLANPGSPLGGTVGLAATATDAESGVASVTFQVAPAGTATWTDIGTDAAGPFTASWDTTGVANGAYDLRATIVDNAGNTATSAVVASRIVQNVVAPAGYDVQATNAQTPGRLAAGDTITFTWTRQMAAASLIPGWTGIGPTTVYVRLRDGSLAGGSDQADVLDVWTNSAATGATGLGTVALKGDFVSTGGTLTWTGLASLSSPTVNGASAGAVTISLLASSGSGQLRTSSADAFMIWTPSATATDTSGVAASAQAVSESGVLDRDF
ncbi:MAG: hypothetical protein QOD86_1885 [Miltoncostaeaceae bacterium]|jgi:hypothetical protein|nr:hypothetical protein [Miltoncostaeaceae bacterium]